MQHDLKCVKNANSPDFPGYLISNENFNIRASVDPKAQLNSGSGYPGFISVKDIKALEVQGRSPIKTAAEMHRN